MFLIHSEPVAGDFQVEVAIAERSLLQPFLQTFRAGCGDVVLHGPVNEAAALARACQAVKGTDRGFRQDDVGAFCHGMDVNDLSSTFLEFALAPLPIASVSSPPTGLFRINHRLGGTFKPPPLHLDLLAGCFEEAVAFELLM